MFDESKKLTKMDTQQNWVHFVEWFDRNMIYCEQAHSFTHRLFDAFNKEKPENYREAQTIAWRILTTMQNEFFSGKPQEEIVDNWEDYLKRIEEIKEMK